MKPGSKPPLDPTLVPLWQKVRARRRELRLTIHDVSERSRLTSSYISHVECGYRDPSLSTLDALSTVLEISLSELLGPPEPLSPAAKEAGRLFEGTADELKPALLEIMAALTKPRRAV